MFHLQLNISHTNSLGHAYVVGLIKKSGGLLGSTEALRSYVESARSAQGATFLAGIIVFFDDYANCLVAGSSMRPLADACGLSREKLGEFEFNFDQQLHTTYHIK